MNQNSLNLQSIAKRNHETFVKKVMDEIEQKEQVCMRVFEGMVNESMSNKNKEIK